MCVFNQWGLITNGSEKFRSQEQTEGINNCCFQVNGIDRQIQFISEWSL